MIFKNYQSDFELHSTSLCLIDKNFKLGAPRSSRQISRNDCKVVKIETVTQDNRHKNWWEDTTHDSPTRYHPVVLIHKTMGEYSGVGIVIASVVCMLTSCKPVEKVVYVPKVHNVVTTIYSHDTVVVVEVPETYAERVTTDTVSELSTPFAYSRAEVSGGKLSHSLGTHGELPTSVRIEEKVVTIRDSIPYRVEVPVYIEKEIRGWRLWVYYAGVAAIVVASVAVYRRIRRPFS